MSGGDDPAKDQSYFLYALGQRELARLRFPVGNRTKAEVFELARSHGLSCAELPESQDLCFAVRGETRFLFEKRDFEPGPILDPTGRELGTHTGLPNYTIGQRRGLGIPFERPLYVVGIDRERNTVVVGEENALFRSDLAVVDASYVSEVPPETGQRVFAKIRYRSPAALATVHAVSLSLIHI